MARLRFLSGVGLMLLLWSCTPGELPIASRSASPSPYLPSVVTKGFRPPDGIVRHRLDFAPHLIGAVDGEVWVAGTHAAQRLVASTGRPLRPPLKIEKTLMAGTIWRGHLWAVGGGDGGDPFGELLEIGKRGVLRRISVGGSPRGIVFVRNRFWLADASGQTLIVVDPVTQRVVRTPVAGEFISTLTKGAGSIWALSSGSGGRSFTSVDPVSFEVGPQRQAGKCPTDIVVRGNSVWVADYCRDVVRRFTTSGRLREVIRVGHKPTALLLVGKELWVANAGSRTVMRVALDEGNLISEYPVGGRPTHLEFVYGAIWIANATAVGSVTRIEK